jgi:hypothetical protein
LNPGRRGGKLATNRLSYGAAFLPLFTKAGYYCVGSIIFISKVIAEFYNLNS